MGKRSRRRGDKPDDGPTAGAATAEAAADGDAPAADERRARRPGATGASPLASDGRLHQAQLLIEEADHLGHLYRWIVLAGEVPRAQDWLRREDWPHPDDVIHVFGSWEKFLQHAQVPESRLLARLRTAEDGRARGRRPGGARPSASWPAWRTSGARPRPPAAAARRPRPSARRPRPAPSAWPRQLERAEARAALAEAAPGRAPRSRPRRARRRARTPRTSGSPPTRRSRTSSRPSAPTARSCCARSRRSARRPPRRAGRSPASRRRARGGRARPRPTPRGPPTRPRRAPSSEAVDRAAAEAPRAALHRPTRARRPQDSPFRRPADILDALRRLDRLAGLYADPAGFGTSLTSAAQDLGLKWRQDVSEIARSRNPHAYSATVDGRRVDLGPHVAIGSGSGAGFIARIYLHVADGSGEVPRGLYVGHVGRHLPDTTTG